MAPHPYRVLVRTAPETSGVIDSAQLEERCLAVVLLLAGATGIVIGFESPRAHGVELVLGALFAALGVWTPCRRWRREEDDASR